MKAKAQNVTDEIPLEAKARRGNRKVKQGVLRGDAQAFPKEAAAARKSNNKAKFEAVDAEFKGEAHAKDPDLGVLGSIAARV